MDRSPGMRKHWGWSVSVGVGEGVYRFIIMCMKQGRVCEELRVLIPTYISPLGFFPVSQFFIVSPPPPPFFIFPFGGGTKSG